MARTINLDNPIVSLEDHNTRTFNEARSESVMEKVMSIVKEEVLKGNHALSTTFLLEKVFPQLTEEEATHLLYKGVGDFINEIMGKNFYAQEDIADIVKNLN